MIMGATFCNLYCRDEQANALMNRLSAEDRVLNGFNGWCMALAEDRGPKRMKSVARKISGDALVFYYFDDEYFELTLFRDGKKTASIGSGGTGSKLSELAGLLPSDPKALKKLRALKHCASNEEAISLLEETFGLPFYALHEQKEVPAVKIGEETWNTVSARIEAFRKRLNRFLIQPLKRDEWPYSTQISMDFIARLRKSGLTHSIPSLLYDLPNRLYTQPGCPACILFPTYIPQHGEKSWSGYNAIITADYNQHETKKYSFPFSVGRPLLVNRSKEIICVNDRQNALLCLDEQGNEQWRFAPEMVRPLLVPVRTNREEIVILCSDYGSSSTADMVLRISPDNGQVLNERVLTDDRKAEELRWLPDIESFMYYVLKSNSVVLLDCDFGEIRRYQLGDKHIRFDAGFLSGHHAYTHDLLGLDLLSGERRQIHPELPAFIDRKLTCGIFAGFSGNDMSTLNLLDQEGIVISRHHFTDQLLGIWEEDGNIYGATIKRSRFPGLWEDSILDSVSVFQFVESLSSVHKTL